MTMSEPYNHIHPRLQADLDRLPSLLDAARDFARYFFDGIDHLPAAADPARVSATPFNPTPRMGAAGALEAFIARYGSHLTASTGARYWGFVTGGTTPAALIGDWLASTLDLNGADAENPTGTTLENEAIALLRDLFHLPDTFTGVFVSGATMSNAAGLATGREWVSQQRGYSAAQDGIAGRDPMRVLSAEPHSSIFKALSLIGMGRSSILRVDQLAGEGLDSREAMDMDDLRRKLESLNGEACIVSASGGTVNTVDFDDFERIAALKREFPFWLHVDAAFGGFAACSPRYAHLMRGIEHADSITIDGHKWLNVPYDSAMIFTRHPRLQSDVFQNRAAYLGDRDENAAPPIIDLTPENSRRLRALPAWFTLMAYGADGYREIVERDCALAQALGDRIAASDEFRLLAPVRMSVVCFTLSNKRGAVTREKISALLRAIRDDGRVFLTPTAYGGSPGVRAAFVNWRTTARDLDIAWDALTTAAQSRS